MAKTDYRTPEDYFAVQSPEDRAVLERIEAVILEAAPDAERVISYQLPAYKSDGFFIFYISAYSKHYGLSLPPPSTIFTAFKAELEPYVVSKSAIQLPKDRPVPYDLIRDMAAFTARENRERAAAKPKKKA